ncbi:hypothetical protein F0U44_18360 [Nocardioides humilatus]|uniref:Secreted protein n=1 Tax=Nocardioides humilatus TaxID=2607660 RepID=A0A5B1L939_9ACTN|nr:hypothetical protein [Nocardioides humilatus]KAA1417132.1 hypothetical protein F0U44_18360 [Nocardioides humilatus]
MRLLALLVVGPVALVGALVAPSAVADTPPPAPHYTYTGQPSDVWFERPDDTFLRLRPWTYCWTSPVHDGEQVMTCADGIPPAPEHQRRITSGQSIRFWFGRPGWRFRGSEHMSSVRHPDDDTCTVKPVINRKRPHWFRLVRPERPGIYEVVLFGDGPEGDVFVSFKWRVGKYDSPAAC